MRAGAIKAALLSYGCIVEAVLRSHAEKRDYNFSRDADNRTFGVVIEAWENAHGSKGSVPTELQSVWQDIKDLKNLRNDIHLHKAAKSEPAKWRDTLQKEDTFFENIKLTIKKLKELQS